MGWIKKQKDSWITSGTYILTVFVSLFAKRLAFNETDVIMVYILGILIVSYFTNGYKYSTTFSVLSIIGFNFFFTEPYYSLHVYNRDYMVTFVIMFIVAIVVSAITTKLKKQIQLTQLREKRMNNLYQLSERIIKARNRSEVINECLYSLSTMMNYTSVFIPINEDSHFLYNRKKEDEAVIKDWVEKTGRQKVTQLEMDVMVKGKQAPLFLLPVIGQNEKLGLLVIWCNKLEKLTKEEKLLADAIRAQLIIGLERENYAEKENDSKVAIERERLRGNLLRSISHDLRTPLTSILGSTETLQQNDTLDTETREKLLDNISGDTKWLIHSVENILNMTKVDEGKLELNKQLEGIEEIVSACVLRTAKNMGNRKVNVHIPSYYVMVEMDGILIQQVIMNLLDNAVKYTDEDATIDIDVTIENEQCVFEVSDNGCGISEGDLSFIFNRFYRSKQGYFYGRSGLGLGLTICQSIIQAHGGKIEAYNNSNGGATFHFTLPGGIVSYE